MMTAERLTAMLGRAIPKIKTYQDIDRWLIEQARKMPVPQNGGYSQALEAQLGSGPLAVEPVFTPTASASIGGAPQGLYRMGSGAAITLTVPLAPIAGTDDGKLSLFYTDTAHAHIVSFTGATLLSVGVAKTTSTSGGLIGEFLLTMSVGVLYASLVAVGQTFA